MNEFLDAIDQILASPSGEVRQPVAYAAPNYSEPCSSCRGTGQFRSYTGRLVGQCFKCKGAGKKTFKSSPEARATAKQKTAEKKVTAAQEKYAGVLAWQEANPEVWAWMQNGAATGFEFAVSLNTALYQWGSLTEGQMNAAKKCVAKLAEAKAAKAAKVESAPQVNTAGVDRLKTAFDKAVAYASEKGLTMKTPKITIGGMVISPAKATSANPGAIYVKEGTTYLGKINNGQFFASRECSEATETKVLEFVANPMQAAEAYGQTTGVCCICNATLTSKWKLRGIGPICAEKYGWS